MFKAGINFKFVNKYLIKSLFLV